VRKSLQASVFLMAHGVLVRPMRIAHLKDVDNDEAGDPETVAEIAQGRDENQ
jgi:hypothetical protein